ncbi:MAG: hypothetical protein IPN22_02300 [Bacteroidetes bacterium]|nr:hypothetical protein [Bacteroidota bacterium]
MDTCSRMSVYRYLFAFFIAFWFSNTLQASENLLDQTATIRLVFASDSKPFADAIIRVIPLNKKSANSKLNVGISDASGIYSFPVPEPVIITVSYLGYSSFSDTLWSAVDKTYKMVAISQDIKDVVVTGQYAVGSVQKSVYEIKVINAETIRAKGANNLREALQNELNIDLGQDAVFEAM